MTRLEKLERCLYRVIGPLPKDMTPTASLVDDLGLDSLDHVELVMEIEQEFKIEVSEVEGDRLKSWGDCITLMNKLVAEKEKKQEVDRREKILAETMGPKPEGGIDGDSRSVAATQH